MDAPRSMDSAKSAHHHNSTQGHPEAVMKNIRPPMQQFGNVSMKHNQQQFFPFMGMVGEASGGMRAPTLTSWDTILGHPSREAVSSSSHSISFHPYQRLVDGSVSSSDTILGQQQRCPPDINSGGEGANNLISFLPYQRPVDSANGSISLGKWNSCCGHGGEGSDLRGKQGPQLPLNDLTKQSASSTTTNTSSSPIKASAGHTQDHIMAERRRREKLTQRFIALSAIVPDLKRTDKASILGDTIKYVKRLQERTKLLEDQIQESSGGSKGHIRGHKKVSGSALILTEVGDPVAGSDPPEIEVRIVDNNVLIRVHCKKRKGLLLESVGELEKLDLVVLNANVLSFAGEHFDLTFNAQMGDGLKLAVDDIIKALRAVFFSTTK